MHDIDQIMKAIRLRHPDVAFEQLKATHPADDHGIWFLRKAGMNLEIQLESATGTCPFTIESNFENKPLEAKTVDDVVAKIEILLEFARTKQHSQK